MSASNIEIWAKGALAAVISGGASSISGMVVDPSVFNPNTAAGWKHIGVSALVGSLIGLVAYLKQSPVPPNSNS